LHKDDGNKTPHRRLRRKKILGILEKRRHYTHYLNGLPNMSEYCSKIVTVTSLAELDVLLHEIVQVYDGFAFAPARWKWMQWPTVAVKKYCPLFLSWNMVGYC
jgi:hypothetical protein